MGMPSEVFGADEGPDEIDQEEGGDGAAEEEVEHRGQIRSQSAAYATMSRMPPVPSTATKTSSMGVEPLFKPSASLGSVGVKPPSGSAVKP